MGLINLQTDLKSLRFGNDRVHSGNSGQPYIQTPIPERTGEFGFLNQDFILRGGSKAVTDSALDVVRLGKYFTDLRSPSGLLFIAKQNLLSRTAVRTQASGLLNEGVYTPLSTLIEAGGVAFGLHVNKQGLNPFDGPGSIRKYSDIVTPTQPIIINRLVDFYNTKEIVSTNNVNLYSYGGGPGSILGIGKTNIQFASQRTGINNANGKEIVEKTYLTDRASQTINRTSLTTPPLGVANKWFEATKLIDIVSTPNLSTDNGYTYVNVNEAGNPIGELYGNIKLGQWAKIPIIDTPVLPPGAPIPENDNSLPKNGTFVGSNRTITYTQTDLLNIPTNTTSEGESVLISNGDTSKVGDFRALIRKTTNNYTIANAPNYTTKNIENRTNLGDPGASTLKKINNYTNGVSGLGNASPNSYDKINALPIYQSNGPSQAKADPDGSTITNDLVKFRIGVYDLTGDSNIPKNYIHFRAFLNNISDQYDADWNPTQYIGRGEKFYTYGGFNRKVSLSWTVAAQSKAELIPMYKKLNYLASVCAPDYSSAAGYMRGNIVTLTIGGYFYEQPGIITGFSYEMNDDNATWEIGIPDTDSPPFVDPSVKELPHMIKVSGFNFIPIHNFVPRLQQNSFADTNVNNVLIDNNSYGAERYIALANGANNNYDY